MPSHVFFCKPSPKGGLMRGLKFLVISITLISISTSAQTHIWQENNLPIYLEIHAPLKQMFEKAYAGVKNSLIPQGQKRDKSYHTGKIHLLDSPNNEWVQIKIKVRGQTSIAKASFPKLTIKIDQTALPEAFPFLNKEKVKIATHLSNDIGVAAKHQKTRLKNDLAPYRESLMYRLMQQLGIQGQRSKVAKIRWVDTSPIPLPTIERQAFLLEHISSTIETLFFSEKIEEQAVSEEFTQNLDLNRAALIHLFQLLIGNWDYRLPLYFYNNPSQDRIHNIYALVPSKNSGQKYLPIPHDFDLASTVTGKLFSLREIPLKPDNVEYLEHLTAHRFQILKQQVPQSLLKSSLQKFISKKDRLYQLLDSHPMDEYGRRNIRQHFDAFFHQVE